MAPVVGKDGKEPVALRRLVTLVALLPRQDYDGRQLRPHFLRKRFGVHGDAAVAFRGACDVRGEALVDLADREDGLFIRSGDMLHVLVSAQVDREDFVNPVAGTVERVLGYRRIKLPAARHPS